MLTRLSMCHTDGWLVHRYWPIRRTLYNSMFLFRSIKKNVTPISYIRAGHWLLGSFLCYWWCSLKFFKTPKVTIFFSCTICEVVLWTCDATKTTWCDSQHSWDSRYLLLSYNPPICSPLHFPIVIIAKLSIFQNISPVYTHFPYKFII